MIRLRIDGQPLPKQRPRFNRASGHAYTPDSTHAHEALIGWTARQQGIEPLAGDVGVAVTFYRTGTRRADLDNLIKMLDGLNGIAWHDDKQIVALQASVQYGALEAYTVIDIWEIER